jgi:hypothetical protein
MRRGLIALALVLAACGDDGDVAIDAATVDAGAPDAAQAAIEGLINGLWGSAPDDIWAVGDGRIYHWDGFVWSVQNSAEAATCGASTANIHYGIWGFSADDIWTVAFNCAADFIHWDGQTWSPAPEDGPWAAYAFEVWGSGPDDVWAGGTSFDSNLWHWDGTIWTNLTAAGLVSIDGGNIFSISGTAEDDAWLIAAPGVYHWDGATWTPTVLALGISAVWSVARDDVWAVGTDIVHFDGTTWTEVTSVTETLVAIHGRAPDDIWAAGTGGSLFHYDGDAWAPVASGTTVDLQAVWVAGPGDVWVAGEDTLRRVPY